MNQQPIKTEQWELNSELRKLHKDNYTDFNFGSFL